MTDQSSPSLSYDVVIATRNRPDVLPLSLPLIIEQAPQPQRVIVVDSSDDAAAVPHALDKLSLDQRRKVTLIQTGPGLPMQRNAGLRESSAEVVMFPDDDALWFPGAASGILEVYAGDREERIGCVGMAESRVPPPAVRHVASSDQRTLTERLIYRIGPWRAKVESWFYARPFEVLGKALTAERLKQWGNWSPPPGCTLAPFIHGFRMTFRRSAIEPVGFDETLSGYALYEDMNVCFDVLRTHVLVNTTNSLTYHHRAAGSRANARLTGAMLILNMIYVTCRHTEPGDAARASLKRYLDMRARQYRVRARDEFGRERLEGINRALHLLDRFVNVESDLIGGAYQKSVQEVTEEEPDPVRAG